MVDMCMAQHHGIDGSRIEGEILLVPCFILLAALDQAAIAQDLMITDGDQVA